MRVHRPVLRLIPEDAPPHAFPPVEEALEQPNGLLAVGADLSPQRLLAAYRRGIFPWYCEGQPILWWSPDPRAVLFPGELRISRSLRKTLRRGRYRVTRDRGFADVIAACARTPRPNQDGTWITAEMRHAYLQLHRLGLAHSLETWDGEQLVGGLYGVAMGAVFFGESMFSWASDASKVALHTLCGLGFAVIDCQVESDFVMQMGAVPIARAQFISLLDRHCAARGPLDDTAGGAR